MLKYNKKSILERIVMILALWGMQNIIYTLNVMGYKYKEWLSLITLKIKWFWGQDHKNGGPGCVTAGVAQQFESSPCAQTSRDLN